MGHQGFASRTNGKRRYRIEHKRKGLCIKCFKKAVNGQVYCQRHREYNNLYQRRLRETLK